MGGNALKNAVTERKSKVDYERIMGEVKAGLHDLFPATNFAGIQAYADKADFGDGDILICDDHLPKDWIAQVQKRFDPKQVFINRIGARPLSFDRNEPIPVIDNDIFAVSFDYEKFQIDLVVVQEKIFRIAQVYYSYNDLGNFMGRIADRMGFKYGWDGLTYMVRKPGDMTITMGKVHVTMDPQLIFEFLGYDIERYKEGFSTMEEVYEFAASSPYFHRSIYALENRNNKDRVRDEKRASYSGFLAWMDKQPDSIDKHEWCSYPLNEWTAQRWMEIAHWHNVGHFFFPSFGQDVHNILVRYKYDQAAKHVWNGKEVGYVSGYKGPELGEFMKFCTEDYVHEDSSRGFIFSAWVMDKSHAEVAFYVNKCKKVWESLKASRILPLEQGAAA